MPNFPNYFLGAEIGTLCDSLGVGLSDPKNPKLIAIYPNPITGNEITISYSVSSSSQVLNIYDVYGKLVKEISLPSWSSMQHIFLPDLSEGIYLAKIGNASLKFSVVK